RHRPLRLKKRWPITRSRAARAALKGRQEAGSRPVRLPSFSARFPPIRMSPCWTKGPSPLPARTRNNALATDTEIHTGSFGTNLEGTWFPLLTENLLNALNFRAATWKNDMNKELQCKLHAVPTEIQSYAMKAKALYWLAPLAVSLGIAVR